MPHVVPLLRQALPELELLLVEEKTPGLLDQLRSGRLDAAVLALPVDDDTLCTEALFREDFLLALPADHPLAAGSGGAVPERGDETPEDRVGVEALAGQRVLLLADGHCLRDHALAVCRLAGVQERDGFRATSLETLRHICLLYTSRCV